LLSVQLSVDDAEHTPRDTLFPYTTLFRSPALELRVVHHPEVKRLGRRDADDRELAQGAPHALECHGARLSPHDELRDERVVMQCDLVALLDPTIPADPGTARHAEVAHHARRGEKVVDRVQIGR